MRLRLVLLLLALGGITVIAVVADRSVSDPGRRHSASARLDLRSGMHRSRTKPPASPSPQIDGRNVPAAMETKPGSLSMKLDAIRATPRSLSLHLDAIAAGLRSDDPLPALRLADLALQFEVPGAVQALLPKLLSLLDDDEDAVRTAARAALKPVPPFVLLAAVHPILLAGRQRAVVAVLELLVRLPPESAALATAEVTSLLQAESAEIRSAAAWSLAEFAREPPAVLGALLEDEVESAREGALEIARRLGPRAAAMWRSVGEIARGSDELARTARIALTSLDRTRALQFHLDDLQDPRLRLDAAATLVRLHTESPTAARALVASLRESSRRVREVILRGLPQLALASEAKVALARRYLLIGPADAALHALAQLDWAGALGYLRSEARSKPTWRAALTGFAQAGDVDALDQLREECPQSLKAVWRRQRGIAEKLRTR